MSPFGNWGGRGRKLGSGSSTTTETSTVSEQTLAQENTPQTVASSKKMIVGSIIAEGKRVNSVAPTAAVIDFGSITLGSVKYKPNLGGDKAEVDIGEIEVREIAAKIDTLNSIAPVGGRILMGDVAIEAQSEPDEDLKESKNLDYKK